MELRLNEEDSLRRSLEPSWPERVGFYDLSLPENATMSVEKMKTWNKEEMLQWIQQRRPDLLKGAILVDGHPVSALNTQWLLRQKIISCSCCWFYYRGRGRTSFLE
jgi:hypothetical protein